ARRGSDASRRTNRSSLPLLVCARARWGPALAGTPLAPAWSSPGAPHRGGGLPPSQPELSAGTHDLGRRIDEAYQNSAPRLVNRDRSAGSWDALRPLGIPGPVPLRPPGHDPGREAL